MEEKENAPEAVEPEELEMVSDIFKTFTKTIKTFNTYPKDNPIYQKFANELSEKFDAYFSKNDDLPLDVGQSALTYKGHEVFRSDERSDNIAFLLFVDGIRDITFYGGLTTEEIIDFIDILRLAPKEGNLEDDIVTLLWEKDIEHLSYFVPEEMREDEAAIEEDFLPVAGGEGTAQTAIGATYSDLTIRPVMMDMKVEPLKNDEITDIRDEALRIERRFLLASAVDLFFELISGEKEISSFAEFVKNIKKVIDIRMEAGDVTEGLEIIKRLRSLEEGVKSAEYKEIVEKAIAKTASMENLKRLLVSAIELETIRDYLLSLGGGAVRNLIEILGEIEDRKLRRLLCNVLAELAMKDTASFGAALEDSRWFLVRNLVMILGMTKDARAVKLIEKAALHPELRVRREAIKALESIPSEETKKPLMKFLSDGDTTSRVNALRALRRFGGADLFAFLKESIASEGFVERQFSEKREYLEAYGEIGRDEAFPLLLDFFKKKSFFKREQNLELRACAAYGLGRVGSPDALELLQSEAESKKNLLREACQRALKEAKKHEKS